MKKVLVFNRKKRKPLRKITGKDRGRNPSRLDPTRTVMLRKRLIAELRKRFARLKGDIVRLIGDEDALGLAADLAAAKRAGQLTTNTRWRFQTSPEKLRLFQEWLRQQMKVRGIADEQLWRMFTEQAMRKGAGRAFDDSTSAERVLSQATPQRLDFYQGSREQFIRDSFRQPVQTERVKTLAARSYSEMEGVTSEMSKRMTRVLVDGMAQGLHSREIAKMLVEDVGFGSNRAEMIAQTECLPAETLVDTAMVRAVFRRWYEGPMVEVCTRSGRKFSATPNHPMLSRRGWIGAGDLQEGDCLVCRSGKEKSRVSGNVDINHGPAPIGEIFSSLEAVGVSERVACAKHDFHGDGSNSDVDILRPDRLLMLGGEFSPLYEHLAHKFLTPSAFASAPFCCFCRRLFPINNRVCLCPGAKSHAARLQSIHNASFVKLQRRSDSLNAFASRVPSRNVGNINIGSQLIRNSASLPCSTLGLAVGPDFNPESAQYPDDPFVIMPARGSDFLGRSAGQVELDQVTLVRVREFCGHVFNLETPYGYFTIDGLYTGNTIRAHAEGQLDAFERLGVEEVGVMVEWATAGPPYFSELSPEERRVIPHVCEQCETMEGVVLTIAEARGMIPRHPGCRCALLPANISEDTSSQKRTKSAIDSAIRTSQRGKDDWGPGAAISKERPQSILNALAEYEKKSLRSIEDD